MKKTLILLAAAVVISIITCGCGGTENSSQNSISTGDTTVSIDEPSTSQDMTTAETSAATPATQSGTEPGIGQSAVVPDVRSQIVQTAQSLVGIDFNLGGASPEAGFDNSGLIYYVLRENGYINCPRATLDQKSMGTLISADELLPGDLVFFVDKDTDDDIGFGGIYVGDGKLIYSPYPGEKVKYADLTGSYWRSNFDCAVRVF